MGIVQKGAAIRGFTGVSYGGPADWAGRPARSAGEPLWPGAWGNLALPAFAIHWPTMSDEMLKPTTEFLSAARELGVEFEPGDLDRLQRFLQLLLEANQTTNLTAITDPAAAWMKHIFDALTLLPIIASAADESEGAKKRVVDVGSGGGVPAIPLAIVMPDVDFTLVEATGKKAAFLTETIGALGLRNAGVQQSRAEPMGQDRSRYREKYDVAIARALGHLAVVAELCGPLVRKGGLVLAVKGAKADQEVEESAKAMGEIGLRHAETVATPTGRIVVLEKTIRTPRAYPRRDGEPARAPLGVPTGREKPKGAAEGSRP